MKILSTKAHGVIDYLVSLLLIASPWLFDFARGGAETWIPVALGAAGILYSLLTNYELGAFKTISMRAHLNLDLLLGILLVASPWVFGFSDFVYMPHLIMGIGAILAALITDPVPGRAHDRESGNVHRRADSAAHKY